MRNFLFFSFLIFSIPLFSEWHTWEETPAENQLIMYVEIEPWKSPSERQILFITHFRNDNLILKENHNGWWDVSCQDIQQWFSEGSKVIYLP